MKVTYTRTYTFTVDKRKLEDFFEVDNGDDITNEEATELFNNITIIDLVDVCDNFDITGTVE